MALDKLVDSTQLDSDLTSVANAIRSKSGTSTQLVFPSGFVADINRLVSIISTRLVGNPITFNGIGSAVDNLSATIEYSQDLHGYDAPWGPGSGVNLLPPPVDGTYTGNGVTAVVQNGTITFSGTATANGNAVIIPLSSVVHVPVGSYVHLLNTDSNVSHPATFELSTNISQTNVNVTAAPVNKIYKIDKTVEVTWDRIRCWLASGTTVSGSWSPMLCLDDTPRDFVPYANACPIEVHSEANIFVAAKNHQQNPTTYNISFGSAGSIGAGTINFTTGELTVTDANISSYNGESINEPWVSSLDEYVSGTLPSTGAQVVYPLVTPSVYNLTPTPIETLFGVNVFWSDTCKSIAIDADVSTFGSKYPIDDLVDGTLTNIESNVTEIKVNAFSGCTNMTDASFPEATKIGSGGTGVFGGCKSLVSISIPKLQGSIGVVAFSGCESLPEIDLAPGVNNIYQQAFQNCYALKAVILRRTASVVSLINTAVFSNTPLTGRGGTYSGHVYVPSSLIEAYKVASNWSVLYANYPDIFKTIEGSIYE